MKIEEEIRQQTFENEHQKAVINLLFTSSWLQSLNNRFLKPFGISGQQFNVLRILRGQHPHPATLCNISERMLDKMSNATRLVEKLRHKGLVTRELNNSNRRQVAILITDAGLELLKNIEEKRREQEAVFNSISVGEAQELSRILDKLRS
ncbi:MAG: MarR family transcriptional regulator [Cytophagaceae bacterium]|nr:MarR family transcriptional regulator [Cytophagaceae bacterium]